jgi:hypothetical protein
VKNKNSSSQQQQCLLFHHQHKRRQDAGILLLRPTTTAPPPTPQHAFRWMHSNVAVEDGNEEKQKMARRNEREVLFDAEGNEVFTPEVDPELMITSEPLLPDLQQVVDQHVNAACGQPIEMKRHIVRHWKLDRKRLKKNKRKNLRNEFTLTPFVLIGAYRALLDRLEQSPSERGLAGSNIRTASIPFSWFQEAARGIPQYDGRNYAFPKKFKSPNQPFTDCRTLIVNEAMAMLMRPVVAPFLPPHAWCLSNNVDQVPGITEVEWLGRNTVDYDTRKCAFMFWDLRVDGHVIFEPEHIKIISNMVASYTSHWWVTTLHKLYNVNRRGKKWSITSDQCSSLPALLVDTLLLRLDHSELLKKHPLRAHVQQSLASDKKQKVGIVKPMNFPKTVDESTQLDYHRLGPAILVTFKGSTGLQEKIRRQVSLALKSDLRFDKKFIDNKAFSEIKKQVSAKDQG